MEKLYTNAIILDGTEKMKPYKGSILVDDGIIKDIGKTIKGDYKTIDLNGAYILPGLINAHVHIPATGFPKKKETDSKKLAKIITSCKLFEEIGKAVIERPQVKTELMSGVTTLRAVGGVKHFDSETRDLINAGKAIGPRIIACDSAVTIPGGHMEGTVAIGCHNDEEFVKAIEENVKAKVDWIKIMVTGGVLDATVKGEPGEMKMNAHQVKLCCDTAHKYGLKVSAHTESPMGIKVALENGVDSIEHGAHLDDDVIKTFKKTKKALVCTISPAVPLAKFDQKISKASDIQVFNTEVLFNGIIDACKKCNDAGIPVGLGTDTGCPFTTHYDMWRELEYYHRLVGVSREEALRAATSVNAKILGIDDVTGSLEKGKSADFIVSKNNPLEGFAALRKLEMVVFKGKEYTNPKVKKNEICEKYLDEYMEGI